MIDAIATPNRWIRGETVESLVDGLRVSVLRETRNNWVHVELEMRAHGIEVVSGKIVLSPETWDAIVSGLPPAAGRDGERSFARGGVRGRGLDFDSTLTLSRQPLTDRVVIGLRSKPMPRASCNVETILDDATWSRLVGGLPAPA